MRKKGLVVGDGMCGAGGATTGMLRFFQAADVPIKRFVAINHNPDSITWHTINHPEVVHYLDNVNVVNLRDAFPEGYADVCWFSPTCTQHSRAKGGRPINDQERNGPQEIHKLVTEIYVRHLLIENVPEIVKWGPIDQYGRPIKSREGDCFRAWIASMEAAGYTIEWRITNAADYGAATTRERFLALMTRTGKISWAIPTHSRTGETNLFEGTKKPWEPVRKHLDLSLPTEWVLGRNVPLAAPTLARGWYGMPAIWGNAATRAYSPDVRDACTEGLAYCAREIPKAEKALRLLRTKPNLRVSPTKRAKRRKGLKDRLKRLATGTKRYIALRDEVNAYLTTTSLTAFTTTEPFLVALRGTSDNAVRNSARASAEPMYGVTAGGGHNGVVVPGLQQLVVANRAHNVPRPDTVPVGGITTSTGGGLLLVAPCGDPIVLGQHSGGSARSAGQPAATMAREILVPNLEPITLGQHGGGTARSGSAPIHTLARGGAASLFTPNAQPLAPQIIETNHIERTSRRRKVSSAKPLPSPSTKNSYAVIEGLVVPASSSAPARSLGEPNNTQTTTQRGQRLIPPLAGATDIDISDPAIAERLLLGSDGNLYLARLHFRMIHPQHELAPIMGFPESYKWPKSNTLATKLIGNACQVDWVAAHAEAFLAPRYAPDYLARKAATPVETVAA